MHVDLLTLLVLPLAGFVGMVSGGYWGIGCSWLIVPTALLLGATPMEAAGVALFQMLPSVLPVVMRDAPKLGWQKHDLGRTLILPLAVGSFLFSFGGHPVNEYLFSRFSDTAFQCFFAAVMMYLGAKILTSRPAAYGETTKRHCRPRAGKYAALPALVFGAAIGFLSSLLGIGGGMFFRPLLAQHYHIPEKETANAARLLLLVTSFAGGLAYVVAGGTVQWRIPAFAGLVALGGVAGFPLGVRIHRIVHAAGYAAHIHKSFALVAFLVVLNIALRLTGHAAFSRYLMIALAALLLAYLALFAIYAKRHPKY